MEIEGYGDVDRNGRYLVGLSNKNDYPVRMNSLHRNRESNPKLYRAIYTLL